MKKLFLLSVLFVVSVSMFSQTTIKIGHINSQELLQAMPENDTAQLRLEQAIKELQDEFQTMQVEYNKKKQDLETKRATFSDLIAQNKEAELKQLEQRMFQFQQSAEQEIQNKRMEIFKPVLDKANKVISDVAKENGFLYILDTAQGSVIYNSDSNDIMPLVKKRLGISSITSTNDITKMK